MIVDLHAHYPMHLVPETQERAFGAFISRGARGRLLDRVRARALSVFSRFGNYQTFSSGPRVTVPLLRGGNVGVALSVLLSPFDELDLSKRYGSPPDENYFPRIIRQIEIVETDIATNFTDQATVAHSTSELDDALEQDKTALVHCLEGAYHLGNNCDSIDRNVTELARRGIAYITIAHLFWRNIATNTPALPFLDDRIYRLLFPQPNRGLTELGEATIRAMVREGILIDITHMSTQATAETFALLDQIDPGKTVPVIATHVGYRFGHHEYNLPADTIRKVAERNGVVGVISCSHFIKSGLRHDSAHSFEQSFELLCRHFDRIAEITGSHRYTALGTDLDGYIQPLHGLEDIGCMRRLEDALINRYGSETAELITAGNALKVIRDHWGYKVASAPTSS